MKSEYIVLSVNVDEFKKNYDVSITSVLMQMAMTEMFIQ